HHPHLSAAIVDLCLGAQSAIPICRHLANRNVPFVVHTGYEPDTIEREWPATPIMRKPANPIDVVHALAGAVGSAGARVSQGASGSTARSRALRWRDRRLRQITADLGAFASLSADGAVELARPCSSLLTAWMSRTAHPLSTPIRLRRRLLFVRAELPQSALKCARWLAGGMARHRFFAQSEKPSDAMGMPP